MSHLFKRTYYFLVSSFVFKILGLLPLRGTGILNRISIKAFILSGINGHKYGTFRDFVVASNINHKRTAANNP